MTRKTHILALIVVLAGCGGVDGSGETTSTGPATTVPEATTSTRATTVPTTTTPVSPPATTATTATTSSGPTPPGSVPATVVDVIDGDTIEVEFDGGTVERVRLIGTNAPEGGECYAAEATRGLSDLISGRDVYLEPDVSDRDRFGRLLRYVWTGEGRLVNEVTVAEGWALARDYPPDTARSAQLEQAEQEAIEAGAGLWAVDACGAAQPADVRIVGIEYDAEGDDNFNLNGEWVEITNDDDVPVDFTGWVLKDESASHRFAFPDGFALQPGDSVRIYTGCGDDSSSSLYWCVTQSAVWNNSGDTAFLLDPAGNIVYSYSYG